MTDYSSANLCDAYGKRGALPAGIQALDPSMRLVGSAYPVATARGQNLWLHRALESAERGAVLVVRTLPDADPPGPGANPSDTAFGYWGELMTRAALHRGIRGLVIDGHVRDREAVVASGFPIYCRGVSPRGAAKDPDSPGSTGTAIEFGGLPVALGDLVVGDADGVVIVARREAPTVLERGRRLRERERLLSERIQRGETVLSALGREDS